MERGRTIDACYFMQRSMLPAGHSAFHSNPHSETRTHMHAYRGRAHLLFLLPAGTKRAWSGDVIQSGAFKALLQPILSLSLSLFYTYRLIH